MNKPNSPRPGSDPSPKSLAQELFGVHFAPGGPLNDPDDLEGLDFGALAPVVAPEPPRLEEHAEEEFAGTTPPVAESADELEPVAEEPVREFRPAPPVKERKPVPRLLVPRDDDDGGFGVGLLDAFEDEDDDEEIPAARSSALTSAQIDVPEDDDAIIDEVRPRAVRRDPEPVADDLAFDDASDEESASPRAAKPKAPHQKDDFWDALEGWDWETSQEGDRGPRSSSDRSDQGRPSGDRPDRGGSSGRGRSDRDEAPRREPAPVEPRREPTPVRAAAEDRPRADRGGEERSRADHPREDRPREDRSGRDRPRREEAPAARDRGAREEVAPAPKPPTAREDRPRGRGERSDRPAREERPAKAESVFEGDEGGFADDLFDRLAQKESGRPSGSQRGRGEVPRDRDADRDRLPPVKKTLADVLPGEEETTEATDEAAAESDQPRRPRRRRGGRGRGAAGDRPVDEATPVESEAGFEDELLADEDDGFGSGLASPRRSPERRPSAERPVADRPAGDRGGSNRGSADRGDQIGRAHV